MILIIGIVTNCNSTLSVYKNKEQVNLDRRKIQDDTTDK